MKRNSTPAVIAAVVAVVVGLALLRLKPWQRTAGPASGGGGTTSASSILQKAPDGRDMLRVGFLPVT
jgi:hypothetical protein